MRRNILSFILLMLAISASAQVSVNYLGDNNTMVKFKANSKYLLIPIQESAPEREVSVLIGGKIMQQMRIRIAQDKQDYLVPLALKPWKGCDIVLNVFTDGRDNKNVAVRDYVCWKGMRLSDLFDTTNNEKWRPGYHHTPPYGWMNDPNGLFYNDGVWHLYYQFNPYASIWANMTWGHATSTDLIHWTTHEPAIYGDGLGDIFSGSAVVDKNNSSGYGSNAIVAFYTSAGRTQQQSMAYSTDGGMTYTKYEGNPVIMNPTECRDPKCVWDEKHGNWVIVIAEANNQQTLFYTSKDLKNWTRSGVFGKGYGCTQCAWECPELTQIKVKGTNTKKWVLIVNCSGAGPNNSSGTQYFIGDFNGKTFICDDAPDVTKWLDWGKDHYAAVTWNNAPNDRRTTIAWMTSLQYGGSTPTRQYRSANTLPRDLEIQKDENGKYFIAVKPSPEIENILSPCKQLLPEAAVTLRLKLNKAGKAFITLSNDNGEKVVMTYNAADKTFSMDRTKSGKVDFSGDFPCTTVAPTSPERTQTLRLFIDRSSIEAFDGDGRFSMTNLVFPSSPYNKIRVDGNCKLESMHTYKINR